jgi:hypothetical protein
MLFYFVYTTDLAVTYRDSTTPMPPAADTACLSPPTTFQKGVARSSY